MLKKILVAGALLGISVFSFAQGEDWEIFWRTDSGDCQYPYCRCTYRSTGGYTISITTKSSYCPVSIEADPTRGVWKEN